MDKLCVVVLNYNDSEHVLNIIRLLQKYDSVSYVVIVDNCSTDQSYEILKPLENEKVKIIQTDKNGGYGYGNNFGIKYARCQLGCNYAIIANPDVEFSEDVVLGLLNVCTNEENCAVVACTQVNTFARKTKSAWKVPNNPWQWTLNSLKIMSKFVESLHYAPDYLATEKVMVDCVQGAMLLVDIDAFLEVGGYDEDIFLYCEEVSLGMRLKECGYKTILIPHLKYYHYHSQSIRKSFPKLWKQQQMILASQEIIMHKTWEISSFEWFWIHMIFKISIFEFGCIGFLKGLKNTRREQNEK